MLGRVCGLGSHISTHPNADWAAHLQVSEAIREGAEGFFATQYGVISRLALAASAAIFGIYLFRAQTPEQEAAGLSRCCARARASC